MSAFLVDYGHIDYLVHAIRAYQVDSAYIPATDATARWERVRIDAMSDTELGRMLIGTNLTSMIARYGDSLTTDERDWIDGYETSARARFGLKLSSVQVIKACRCYAYQCCEYDGWESSAAHDLVTRVTVSAYSDLPGYAEAAWEITREPK